MRILEFVQRYFPEAKKSGQGFKTQCPAHDDQDPSLVLSEGKKGVLVHCHRDCKTDDILLARGIPRAHLFFEPMVHPPEKSFSVSSWALQDLKGKTIAVHYRKGTPTGEVVWWERNGQKGLRGLKAKDLPLYRTQDRPRFDKSRVVFLCEGEKDTDALRALGEQALGTITGADSTPSRAVLECLRSCNVVVVPNNTDIGRDHMRRCASFLKNVAADVSMLELPDVLEGGAADWVERQKKAGLQTPEQIRAALQKLPRKKSIEKKAFPKRECQRIPPESEWKPALLEKLQKSDKGKPLSTLDNAIVILAKDPRWNGVLGFNELAQQVVFLRPPLWDEEAAPLWPVELGSAWKDVDSVRLVAWMSRHWGLKLSPYVARDTAALVAERKSFHPIRDQLRLLRWDGQPRLDTWLCRHLGAAETPYVRAVGAKWLISAVARIEKPGAKVDCLLVLEGGQRLDKSQALEILAGMDFSDQLGGDLGSREAAIPLQGKWILEIAEFDKLQRQEAATVKAFISRRTDHYRGPYGRSAQDYPRQCVFCGTTNKTDYLRDETGAKCFWPVQVGDVDLAALRGDREQLWAEARVRFFAGERWWLEGAEAELQKEKTSDRYQGDAWSEPITQWLKIKNRAHVTVPELLREVSGLPEGKWDQAVQNRVARLLIHQGWERRRVSLSDGRRLWRYEAPTPKLVGEVPSSAQVKGTAPPSQHRKTGTGTGTVYEPLVERFVPVVPVVPVPFLKIQDRDEDLLTNEATKPTGTRRVEKGFAEVGEWDKERNLNDDFLPAASQFKSVGPRPQRPRGDLG